MNTTAWRNVYRHVRRGGFSRNRTSERDNIKTWRNRDTGAVLQVPVIHVDGGWQPLAIIETTQFLPSQVITYEYDIQICGVMLDAADTVAELMAYYEAIATHGLTDHPPWAYWNNFAQKFGPHAATFLLDRINDAWIHIKTAADILILLRDLAESHPNMFPDDIRLINTNFDAVEILNQDLDPEPFYNNDDAMLV